uniref:Large ribosomal subunit protein mL50 n=1 Tax=Strongyloides venezuelensis TaxID=75913 RepID=A0A0K0EZX4_STRVS
MIAGRCLSQTSRRIAATRNIFFLRSRKKTEEEKRTDGLTNEEKEQFKLRYSGIISKLVSSGQNVIADEIDDAQPYLDSIRARGILPYKYNYNPPSNLKDVITNAVSSVLSTKESDFSKIDLSNNLKDKASLLIKLGNELSHHIPNSTLHEIKTVADVYNFYSEPVSNVTEYVEMVRDPTIPKNISMKEEAVRFHPEDVESYHGGVTAFPGTGGEVYGLRNKRIHREFNPRKEWYDYEDTHFDYTKIDANKPWDPRIAEKMDKYVNRKYKLINN